MSNRPDYQQLYDIAEGQAGYFTAKQARSCGFTWERLSSNAKNGRFSRVHHGVYRLTQFPGSAWEDLFVAWLRAGPEAVISHESALALYDLSDVLPHEIHVIVPRTASRRRSGFRQHTHQLEQKDINSREGLPVTTILRTLADVAASGLAEEQIHLAIQEAIERGLITLESVRKYAQERGGRFQEIVDHLQSLGRGT